jgi:hypothetical protein
MQENKYYRVGDVHYYKKVHDGALHVMKRCSINIIPEYFLPIIDKVAGMEDDLVEIEQHEFESAIRETIFELEIYPYFER